MHADAAMRRAPGAVPHATPHGPQVLVNQPVTLALPGARAGDLVMIVRQPAQGGCVEAASGGGCWGILCGPATGLALSELILDGAAASVDITPFSPQRFA